jgi:hypothetical protein
MTPLRTLNFFSVEHHAPNEQQQEIKFIRGITTGLQGLFT